MDALAEVRNEETHLQDADPLRVSSVLAAHSSIAHPTTPVLLASPPIVPPTTHDESVGLHYDHCG
jgi:hypothetical protein